MSFNVGEAHDMFVVARWVLGRDPSRGFAGARVPDDDQAAAALTNLVGRAYKGLGAGINPEDFARAWPERRIRTDAPSPAASAVLEAADVAERYRARSRELAGLVLRLHEQLAARTNWVDEVAGELEGDEMDVLRHPEHVRDAVERAVQLLSTIGHDAPSCRLCGCTEFSPCETESGPCGWAARTEHGLECSACVGLDAGDLPIEEPHPDRASTAITVIEPVTPTWPVMLDGAGEVMPPALPVCEHCFDELRDRSALTKHEEWDDGGDEAREIVVRECSWCGTPTSIRLHLTDLVSRPIADRDSKPANKAAVAALANALLATIDDLRCRASLMERCPACGSDPGIYCVGPDGHGIATTAGRGWHEARLDVVGPKYSLEELEEARELYREERIFLGLHNVAEMPDHVRARKRCNNSGRPVGTCDCEGCRPSRKRRTKSKRRST